MKKSLILLGALAAIVAAFFIFKAAQPKSAKDPDKALVVGFENDVVSLDPIRIGDVYSVRVVSQIFQGLARLNEDNEVVGGVAESWTHSPDLTRWTFKLRSGVKFHPHPSLDEASRLMTAEDVIYSFTRMLSKDAVTTGPLASVLKGAKEYQDGSAKSVSGLRAVSASEVEFTMVRPDALFLGRISSPSYGIVKKAVVDAAGSAFGQSVAVGTGPFRFIERRGNDLVLQRNEEYWDDNKGPRTVIFRTVKEDTVRLAEAKAGRLDVTYATAPMLDGLVQRDGDSVKVKPEFAGLLTALSFPTFNTTFLAFNWPKVDPDLRRAIALAVDRGQIVKAVTPLSGTVAPDPIPYACAGYTSKITAARDLEGAKTAVARYRAGHQNSAPKIRILAHELAQSVPISEVLQSQLKEAGIEVEIVQQSFNAVIGLIQKKDFDAMVIWFEYMYAKPQLMLETYFTSGAMPLPNVFQYSKPENDAAITALFSNDDQKASLEQSAEVAKNLVADDPGVFLFQNRQVILVKPGIVGLRFNASNLPILTRTVRQN
jgi:ABC-type transport system substrate-binding protein